MSDWCVVIPSNRKKKFNEFMGYWDDYFCDKNVTMILVEDNPKKTFSTKKFRTPILHYSWSEIDSILEKNKWIIPRKTCDIRSFGLLMAYRHMFDYVLTLDDDVKPLGKIDLLEEYNKVFRTGCYHSNYYNVGLHVSGKRFMRGFPFKDRESKEVLVQFGGWYGSPDLDAITQLVNPSNNLEVFDSSVVSVPKFCAFTGCSMNVALDRRAIPVWYQLLMGGEYPFDRAGDIWSGYILKAVFDNASLPVVINGKASVVHNRASNAQNNLVKESSGYALNEKLWYRINLAISEDTISLVDSYASIAKRIKEFDLFDNIEYSNKLSKAMLVWLKVLEE